MTDEAETRMDVVTAAPIAEEPLPDNINDGDLAELLVAAAPLEEPTSVGSAGPSDSANMPEADAAGGTTGENPWISLR